MCAPNVLQAPSPQQPQPASHAHPASEGAQYLVGDRVWGRYSSGRWYPARVAEARGDGWYVLDWEDGDPQDRVKGPEEVKLPFSFPCTVCAAREKCPFYEFSVFSIVLSLALA